MTEKMAQEKLPTHSEEYVLLLPELMRLPKEARADMLESFRDIINKEEFEDLKKAVLEPIGNGHYPASETTVSEPAVSEAEAPATSPKEAAPAKVNDTFTEFFGHQMVEFAAEKVLLDRILTQKDVKKALRTEMENGSISSDDPIGNLLDATRPRNELKKLAEAIDEKIALFAELRTLYSEGKKDAVFERIHIAFQEHVLTWPEAETLTDRISDAGRYEEQLGEPTATEVSATVDMSSPLAKVIHEHTRVLTSRKEAFDRVLSAKDTKEALRMEIAEGTLSPDDPAAELLKSRRARQELQTLARETARKQKHFDTILKFYQAHGTEETFEALHKGAFHDNEIFNGEEYSSFLHELVAEEEKKSYAATLEEKELEASYDVDEAVQSLRNVARRVQQEEISREDHRHQLRRIQKRQKQRGMRGAGDDFAEEEARDILKNYGLKSVTLNQLLRDLAEDGDLLSRLISEGEITETAARDLRADLAELTEEEKIRIELRQKTALVSGARGEIYTSLHSIKSVTPNDIRHILRLWHDAAEVQQKLDAMHAPKVFKQSQGSTHFTKPSKERVLAGELEKYRLSRAIEEEISKVAAGEKDPDSSHLLQMELALRAMRKSRTDLSATLKTLVQNGKLSRHVAKEIRKLANS